MTYEELEQQIKERQFAEVPFTVSQGELSSAAEVFLAFLTLPQEVKDKFYFKLDKHLRKADVGYVRKNRDEGGNDNKEYFHYHPRAQKEFKEHDEFLDRRVQDFFTYADKIHRAASNTMEETIRLLDTKFPGTYNRFFPEGIEPRFYLRFLKYETGKEGDFLAKSHYDAGTCTLAMAESSPGLRIGKTETSMKPVTHTEGTAIFMPAYSLQAVTSDIFSPAWHEVVQLEEDKVSSGVARWAIVMFADQVDVVQPTPEQCHTPMD